MLPSIFNKRGDRDSPAPSSEDDPKPNRRPNWVIPAEALATALATVITLTARYYLRRRPSGAIGMQRNVLETVQSRNHQLDAIQESVRHMQSQLTILSDRLGQISAQAQAQAHTRIQVDKDVIRAGQMHGDLAAGIEKMKERAEASESQSLSARKEAT